MGLCASAAAGTTATASVSPTRLAQAGAAGEAASSSSSSSANKANKTSASVSPDLDAKQRSVTLRKVGEQSFMSNLVTSGGSITDQYDIDGGEVLGEGMSCVVRTCIHRASKRKMGLKAVKKNRLQQEKIVDMRREIEIMKALDHPNIVKLYQTFEDHSYIYMIMELCSGGELFDGLANCASGHYEEYRAAELIQKMLSALNYCHMRKVCHRDLKLENFIFENASPDSEIKLIDFGLSKVYMDGMVMHNVLGTSYYVAPEVLAGSYGIECDLWGLGVLAFMLLSGQAPFSGATDADIMKLVRIGKYSFSPSGLWRGVSKPAQDFIKKLLVINPKDRMTAKQALDHPWMVEHSKKKLDAKPVSEEAVVEKVYGQLRSYRKFKALKRAALLAIAYTLSQDEIEASREQFERLDTEHNGYIRCDQLRQVLEDHGIPDQEVQKIFDEIDQDNSGTIDYSEFIAAAMGERVYLDEENLHDAFHRLDIDGTGFLTVDGLMKILAGSYAPDEVSWWRCLFFVFSSYRLLLLLEEYRAHSFYLTTPFRRPASRPPLSTQNFPHKTPPGQSNGC